MFLLVYNKTKATREKSMATPAKRKRTCNSPSSIWDSFVKNEIDPSKPTCRKCRKVVSRGSSNAKSKSWGNGSLWEHLKICSPSGSGCPSTSSTTQLNIQQALSRNTPLQKGSVKAKAITNAIGKMVAIDLRPYSVVENEGFRELMRVLEPRYSIVSRKELTNVVVPEIYSDLEGKIKESIQSSKSGINFTTDMWKCEGQNREYLTVTAHLVVENSDSTGFEVKNALLVVEEFLNSAHSYNIRKSVGEIRFHNFIEVCLFANTLHRQLF